MSIKFLKSQRGEATMIIIAIVAVAVIGGAVWYAVGHHSTKSVAKTATQKANQSACMKVYNDNTICNFAVVGADFEKLPYTAILSDTQNGTTSTLTIKTDGKGNSETTTSEGGTSSDFITLSGNTYIQNGGSWIEYPASSTSVPNATTNPADSVNFDFAANQTKFTKLGTVACGSLACVKYDVVSAGVPYTIWIDTTNYYMEQLQGTSAGATFDMTFTYGPVSIATPSPVTTF